ncbi:hypothetical protein ACH4ZX_15990 [Streptomyces sp. NPDC020490]|uniref:hypothetical protein n=1 Tax=Streptomyces sp. NPDC020490 TaxID=3365078 RepID=UPI0037906F9E
MDTFHSWDEVRDEIFDEDDLDEIRASAQKLVAQEPAPELTEQERHEAEEALGLTHGRDRHVRRPGHAL